ncbi:MAG: ferrous iron transport protein A [Synergistetes bacterium]|nr:ferrous iron transport protein A [Synergistota bacterium]
MIESGKKIKIKKIIAGKTTAKKLQELGLLEGEYLCVLTNSDGPIIVIKDNLRFAIGRGLSHKILVEEVA